MAATRSVELTTIGLDLCDDLFSPEEHLSHRPILPASEMKTRPGFCGHDRESNASVLLVHACNLLLRTRAFALASLMCCHVMHADARVLITKYVLPWCCRVTLSGAPVCLWFFCEHVTASCPHQIATLAHAEWHSKKTLWWGAVLDLAFSTLACGANMHMSASLARQRLVLGVTSLFATRGCFCGCLSSVSAPFGVEAVLLTPACRILALPFLGPHSHTDCADQPPSRVSSSKPWHCVHTCGCRPCSFLACCRRACICVSWCRC